MFEIIRNHPEMMLGMADEIFGKKTTLSKDEKVTLMRIFLTHPELMEGGGLKLK
jgi:hypothetical protein